MLVLTARIASAEPRVLIVETPQLPLPSLGTRITLHGGDAIEVRTIDAVADMPAAAPALLGTHDATLVLWI